MQRIAFGYGYKWIGESDVDVRHTDSPALFFNPNGGKVMTHSSEVYFSDVAAKSPDYVVIDTVTKLIRFFKNPEAACWTQVVRDVDLYVSPDGYVRIAGKTLTPDQKAALLYSFGVRSK